MVKYKHGHYTSTEAMEVTILLVKDKYGNIQLGGSKTYDVDVPPLKFSAKLATYKYEDDKLKIFSSRDKEKVLIEIGTNSAFPDDSI